MDGCPRDLARARLSRTTRRRIRRHKHPTKKQTLLEFAARANLNAQAPGARPPPPPPPPHPPPLTTTTRRRRRRRDARDFDRPPAGSYPFPPSPLIATAPRAFAPRSSPLLSLLRRVDRPPRAPEMNASPHRPHLPARSNRRPFILPRCCARSCLRGISHGSLGVAHCRPSQWWGTRPSMQWRTT